jgi:hypothetical protein
MVELYFHSPIRLHDLMLNYLRTGPALPFTSYTDETTTCEASGFVMLHYLRYVKR